LGKDQAGETRDTPVRDATVPCRTEQEVEVPSASQPALPETRTICLERHPPFYSNNLGYRFPLLFPLSFSRYAVSATWALVTSCGDWWPIGRCATSLVWHRYPSALRAHRFLSSLLLPSV